MTEQWKQIPGYPDYDVSDFGRVRSYKRGRVPKVTKVNVLRNGYPSITIRCGKTPRTTMVHQLVATTFLGDPPDGCQICHNDGLQWNPRLDNLRYDTAGANIRERRPTGEGIDTVPLDIRHDIADAINAGEMTHECAKQFRDAITAIPDIPNTRAYRIPAPVPAEVTR